MRLIIEKKKVNCLWLEMKPNIQERYKHFISELVKEVTDLQYKVFNSNIIISLPLKV